MQAEAEVLVEKSSKNTLEYFLNRAEEHVVNGDVDDCIESIRRLFDEAISEGKAIMEKEDASYGEVMDATVKLMKAIQALKFKAADKTDLEMTVELAQMIDLSKYVEAGQAQFAKEFVDAQKVLADGDAFQEDVDNVWNALLEAISNLKLKADKSVLEDLLNSVKDLDLSKYTEESVATFKVALARTEAMMANEALSEDDQKVVNEAVKLLAEAKDQLKIKESSDGDDNNNGNQTNGSLDNGNKDKANTPKTGDMATSFGILLLAVIAGGIVLIFFRKKYSK